MACYKPVTHVIFDLDGTILDTEEVFTTLYQSIAEKYGKRLTWAQRAQAMGRTADEAVGFMIRELNLPISVEEFHHIARTEFHEKIRDGLLGCKLKPGVERLVKQLHNNSVPLAIATSSKRETFELKTQNHRELLGCFHHSVIAPSDPEVERGKPAPDVFLVCARRFPDSPTPQQEVDVRDNSIESIDTAFQHESNLEILNAGRNPLYEISDSAFGPNMRNLRILILDHCELTFLPFAIFNSLTKLEKIDLSLNRLESLPFEIFRNLNNLVEVNLKENRLSYLGDVFIRSPNLESIILSNNYLQSCEDIFRGLHNLQYVDLRDNKLKTVSKNCFSASRMLNTLQLSKNRIYHVDTNAFTSLKHLKQLSLSHNKLTYLNGCVKNMSELEILYLNHNMLMEVSEYELKNLPKLKRLNLGYNRISTVTRSFRNLFNLESLTLSKNKLKTLARSTFPLNFAVKKIFLSGNKWVCDCRLMWILTAKISTHLADRIKCSEPQRFFGKTLSKLTPLDILTWNEDCE